MKLTNKKIIVYYRKKLLINRKNDIYIMYAIHIYSKIDVPKKLNCALNKYGQRLQKLRSNIGVLMHSKKVCRMM
jgi:hypothetical protein